MKKRRIETGTTRSFPCRKRRIFMRISWIIALGFCLSGHASAYSQQAKVSLEMHDAALDRILQELGKQANVNFLYNFDVIKEKKNVSVNVKEQEFIKVLDELLPALGLDYVYDARVVVIRERNTPARPQGLPVKGKVTDVGGHPLPGVTIRVEGTTLGVTTDQNGLFTIQLPAGKTRLLFSFVGMEGQAVEVDPAAGKEIVVKLKESRVELEDVVITGIYTRAKESFTGSASTYSAAELKRAGTHNVLQGLKTLDPSFTIIEDNLHGSDPNRLPNMEIRGKSSILGARDALESDPNQPLFILDGFESTLEAINDLDINRVASITLLKDAASTAIYGSKAANGVVVVETVKPEAG
ncbi:MAG: carboxypeptidase-like regulatory domain-containing protein, partial [Odoribacteraceae bacterium]|nr:carboxypeptidase-like regulatory domain-containing protein [Odoribacteraceae bacterium]